MLVRIPVTFVLCVVTHVVSYVVVYGVTFFPPVLAQNMSRGVVTHSADPSTLSQESVKPFLWVPFVYYTPETEWAGGTLLRWNFSPLKAMGRVDQITLIGFRTMREQSFVTLSGRWFFREGMDELAVGYTNSLYPDRYFGRGELGYQKEYEIFQEDRQSGSLSYSYHLGNFYFLRLGVTFDQRSFESNGAPSSSALLDSEFQNYADSYQVFCYPISLEYDRRDFIEAPTRGQWHRITAQPCGAWERYDLDLRWYLPQSRGVWAQQILLSQVEGESLPFAALNAVGGRSLVRGYPFGRYRDQFLAAWQSEYRYDWKERWIPVVFVAYGWVGGRMPTMEERMANQVGSWGLGIHYLLDPKVRTKLRLEWASSPWERTFGVYFVNAEAF